MRLTGVKGIAVLLVITCLLVGCLEGGKTVTVLFSDSKGVTERAKVYLAGVVIGKVSKIRLMEGKAAVQIRIDGDKWSGLSTPLLFFIDADPNAPMGQAIMVRNFKAGQQSEPLLENMVFEGIDSPLVWSAMGFIKNIEDLERSEFFRNVQKQLDQKP